MARGNRFDICICFGGFMINSRDIAELSPKVQPMCLKFIGACQAAGIDILITSTYRDNESQNALYAQGRTAKGRKVTNAKGGQSFHNYRVAFDFVPIINGKAQWNDLDRIGICGQIAKQCGLDWAGDWVNFKEMLHCQFVGGLTLKAFQNGHVL